MKTTKIVLASLMLATGFLSSCQSELEESAKGYGYLQLSSVEINKTIESRADVTATEDVAVDIIDEQSTVVKHVDDWNELNVSSEGIVLPVGTYTIQAYSFDKDKDAQGFDAEPYYEGETEVAIVANQAKVAQVTCKLAQSMVKVNYTDNFKTAFKTFACTVVGNSSLSIPFSATETRAAYVKAEQPLSIRLDFGDSKIFTQQITANAEAATRYNVTLDVTSGSAGINIEFDPRIHQYEVTLEVPTKMEDHIVTTDISTDVSKVWGQFAYLTGECNITGATDPVQFCYKKTADADWTTIEATKVGDTYTYENRIAPLDFGTEYQYYIKCGDKQGETVSFTTEAFVEIPNLNFDTWTQSGKNWFPNAEALDNYWATGNTGVSSVKDANSIPVEDDVHTPSGKAAKLQTLGGVAMVNYAAGNIFIGSYSTNIGDPASSVNFGRDYTGARPVKLSGWYKYKPGTDMNSNGKIPEDRTLVVDECDIYIQLWSGESVIAAGHFITNETVETYTKFEIPIEYTDETKHPTKITIVATSSRYGGYFEKYLISGRVVGQVAANSTLWVDDFELSYY